MVPRLLAFRYDYDLARHASDWPRFFSPGHRALKVRAARKAGRAPGRPRGQPIRAPGAERMEAWARGGKFCLLRLLWCSHVACYAVRSARFHRMAPRSEPLGSRPAPWLKTRHWHQIARALAEALQAARTRAVHHLWHRGLAARAALEGDLAKGKGSLEAKGLP